MLASGLLLLATNAQAINFERPRWYPSDHLERIADRLRDPDANPTVTGATAGTGCAKRYASMYGDHETVISVFFGFTELARIDLVFDPFSRAELERRLRTPCRSGESACGFAAVAERPWQSERLITLADGSRHRVVVELFDSAVTDDYSAFADTPDTDTIAAQKRKTETVKALFLDRLARSEVVLYSGHARRGTGPGFGPVVPLSKPWFEAALLGESLHELRSALAAAPRQPDLIGLFACDSRHYYLRDLASVAPDTGFIVSDGDTQPDQDNANLLGTLDALLRGYCKRDFERALKIGGGNSGYELRGFFQRLPEYERRMPNPLL